MKKYSALGGALAALTLVTACGSLHARTIAAHNMPVVCPAAAPRLGLPARGDGGAGLVPAGPVAAAICQYGTDVPAAKTAGMPGRVTLTGVAAAGLAAVLDSAEPVTSAGRRCDRPADLDPFTQEIIFSYPGGRERRVSVAFTDCNLGLVAAGQQAGELPPQTDADLFGYTSITTSRAGSAPAPDLIGLSAAAAVQRARRQHFTVYIDNAVFDQSAAAGTVVFQSLPPGARDGGPGGDVDVIVATGRAPACTAAQLALSYLGGGESAGNDFGTLLIRDTSARPCTLTGPLSVTGLGATGRPDTTTRPDPVTGPAVLTPGAGPVRWRPRGRLAGTRPGELTGVIQLISEYRDGPASVDGGLCLPLWVVPAAWRVVLLGGTALTVANADPGNRARMVGSGGFVTCRGQLGAVAPASVTSP